MINSLPISLIEAAKAMLNAPVDNSHKIRPMKRVDLNRVLEIESTSGHGAWNRASSFTGMGADKQAYVVHKGKDMVGYFITQKKADDVTHLVKLTVDEQHRQTGVAGVIMNHLKDNYPTLTLNVRSTNTPAIKLYEKHGFQHVQELPNYYTDGCSSYNMKYEKDKE